MLIIGFYTLFYSIIYFIKYNINNIDITFTKRGKNYEEKSTEPDIVRCDAFVIGTPQPAI